MGYDYLLIEEEIRKLEEINNEINILVIQSVSTWFNIICLLTFLVKIFFKKIVNKTCIMYIKCDTIILWGV